MACALKPTGSASKSGRTARAAELSAKRTPSPPDAHGCGRWRWPHSPFHSCGCPLWARAMACVGIWCRFHADKRPAESSCVYPCARARVRASLWQKGTYTGTLGDGVTHCRIAGTLGRERGTEAEPWAGVPGDAESRLSRERRRGDKDGACRASRRGGKAQGEKPQSGAFWGTRNVLRAGACVTRAREGGSRNGAGEAALRGLRKKAIDLYGQRADNRDCRCGNGPAPE